MSIACRCAVVTIQEEVVSCQDEVKCVPEDRLAHIQCLPDDSLNHPEHILFHPAS